MCGLLTTDELDNTGNYKKNTARGEEQNVESNESALSKTKEEIKILSC